MNPSERDPISLDEKIALIRKKNEMIIKRKQLIEEEIEFAKKHNAMVDVCAPKVLDDDKPTLYSDTIPKSHRDERKRTIPDKVNLKPRNRNTKDEAAWRAERNEIDRERIRRQRADSGWRREWDADKIILGDEFERDNFDRRSNSKEMSHTRSSHDQGDPAKRSELVSVRQNQYQSKQRDLSDERPLSALQNQYRSKKNDVSDQRPVPTLQNQYKSKQSDVEPPDVPKPPEPRQIKARGRGRPLVSVSNPKITQNLRRTINVEPPKLKEKPPLKKRVSWGSEEEIMESRRISLTNDCLKNIKVKVNTVDSNARNRSIKITEEQGPLVRNQNALKFDENTSFNIKDCVAKASLDKSRVKVNAVKDVPPPKPKESSSVKSEPKSILANHNSVLKPETIVASVAAAEPSSKDGAETGDDEEWEDLSGEDWESASDEE